QRGAGRSRNFMKRPCTFPSHPGRFRVIHRAPVRYIGWQPRAPTLARIERSMFQPAEVTTRSDDTFDAGGVKVTTRRPNKRWLIAGGALLAIVLFLAGTKFLQIFTMIQAGKKMVPPPVAVTTTTVKQVEWQPLRPAVGTLTALRGTTLSAEVTG